MLNERNDKHEGLDDSEYHFSDEDFDYNADSEEEVKSNNSTSAMAAAGTNGNFLSQLTRSRRMILVGVIFFILAFFLYKVLGTKPSIEITPQMLSEMKNASVPNKVAQVPPVMEVNTVATMAPPAAEMNAYPANMNNMPAQTMQAPTQTNAQVQAAPMGEPVVMNPTSNAEFVPSPATQPSMQTQQNTNPSYAALPTTAVTQPPITTPVPTAQPIVGQPPAVVMPPVIAVRSPEPVHNPEMTSNLTNVTVAPEGSGVSDARIAAFEAANQKFIEQLHTDYMQRIDDFAVQEKAIHQQMQALTSRVAKIETQLSQVLENMSQAQVKNNRGAASSANDSHIGFTVQAIIPGRAWLKADNGETITVAEGDPLKEFGRITKIDPYDGIVEIDTGNKTVSLSYGSGG